MKKALLSPLVIFLSIFYSLTSFALERSVATITSSDLDDEACLSSLSVTAVVLTGSVVTFFNEKAYWQDLDNILSNGTAPSIATGDLTINSAPSAGTYRIKYIIENDAFPSIPSEAIYTLTVTDVPATPVWSTNPVEMCEGSSETFEIYPVADADEYVWTIDGIHSVLPDGSNPQKATVTLEEDGTVSGQYGTDATLTVAAKNECGATTPITETIKVLLNARAVDFANMPSGEEIDGIPTGDICETVSSTFEVSALQPDYWSDPSWKQGVNTGSTNAFTIPANGYYGNSLSVSFTANECPTPFMINKTISTTTPYELTVDLNLKNSSEVQKGVENGGLAICSNEGDSYEFEAVSNFSGGEFTFTFDNTQDAPIDNGFKTITTQEIQDAISIRIKVTYEVPFNACLANLTASDQIDLIDYQVPKYTLIDAFGEGVICENDKIVLEAEINSGETMPYKPIEYTLYKEGIDTPLGTTFQSSFTVSDQAKHINRGNYYAKVSSKYCEYTTPPYFYEVNKTPVIDHSLLENGESQEVYIYEDGHELAGTELYVLLNEVNIADKNGISVFWNRGEIKDDKTGELITDIKEFWIQEATSLNSLIVAEEEGHYWYYVTVANTNAEACFVSDSVLIKVIDPTLSTNLSTLSNSNNSIQYYPNPFTDYLEVEADAQTSISIFNSLGIKQSLNTEHLGNKQRLDCSNLKSGIYILQTSKDGIITSQTEIIKQ